VAAWALARECPRFQPLADLGVYDMESLQKLLSGEGEAGTLMERLLAEELLLLARARFYRRISGIYGVSLGLPCIVC